MQTRNLAGGVIAALAAVVFATSAMGGASVRWKPVDPENTLVIDTDRGRLIVELHPEIAPKSVERVKILARRGTYDGLSFWRVVPHFVVQADPGNIEGGVTELPNLPPEFTFRLKADMPHTIVAHRPGVSEGFLGALPYASVSETAEPKRKDGSLNAWGTYCAGMMGMGREEARDSGNAEIFLMTGAYPALDRDYTPVGQVIMGLNALDGLPAGEPAPQPLILRQVHMLTDMKNAPKIEVMDTQSPAFQALVSKARKARGADFSVCDVTVPARVVP